MSGFALGVTMLATLLVGYELTRRCWKDDLQWGERAAFAWAGGTLLWLATTWTLALLHQLDRGVLLARMALLAITALALSFARLRSASRSNLQLDGKRIALLALPLLPVAAWIEFSLWRGAVTPPASIDALAYHLPRAVMFVRAHGYDALRVVRFFLSWRPANYELLLADALAMAGNDNTSEFISTFFYVGFAVSAIALAQRWRARGVLASLTAGLLTAGVPVALLHATDYKNDVMAAFFVTIAIVALDRWLSDHDVRAFAMAVAALAAAAGTKTPCALVAALTTPLLLWPWRRVRISRAAVAAIAALSLASVLLLGGTAYISRVLDRKAPAPAAAETPEYAERTYGHYANLWKAPYLLIAQSFSTDDARLKMPWADAPWAWARYELYYSELGIPFALCAIAFPFALILRRRQAAASQYATTALALLSFAAILPFDGPPIGRYLLGLPRFALTIVPVVFAWTAAPFADWLESRHRVAAYALVLVAAISFSIYAIQNAAHDVFAPFQYVLFASEHPGMRLPVIGRGRAAAVLDEVAGPRDRVAFDGGVSAFLHLTYGAALQRDVTLIPRGDSAPQIDDDAQWVVIDRAWNVIWGNRELRDLSNTALIGRGQATKEDERVLRAMLADRRFAVEYANPRLMQFVFKRKAGQ